MANFGFKIQQNKLIPAQIVHGGSHKQKLHNSFKHYRRVHPSIKNLDDFMTKDQIEYNLPKQGPHLTSKKNEYYIEQIQWK